VKFPQSCHPERGRAPARGRGPQQLPLLGWKQRGKPESKDLGFPFALEA